jgi:hypothetical protein
MFKKTYPFILFCISIVIVICTERIYKRHHTPMMPSLSAQEFYENQLQQEYEKVWQAFEQIGITQEKYQKAYNQYYQQYLRADVPLISPLSAKTKQYVTDLIKECGLEDRHITITAYKERSPASATERTLYINEEAFWSHSEPARRFVIGHELQHIAQKDNSARYVMEILCNTKAEKLIHQKDHPLCQLSRFKEKRADIKTALKGVDWAEGFLAFAKEWYEQTGDNPGVTHPKNADRVQLAHDVVHYMKNQQSHAFA